MKKEVFRAQLYAVSIGTNQEIAVMVHRFPQHQLWYFYHGVKTIFFSSLFPLRYDPRKEGGGRGKRVISFVHLSQVSLSQVLDT